MYSHLKCLKRTGYFSYIFLLKEYLENNCECALLVSYLHKLIFPCFHSVCIFSQQHTLLHGLAQAAWFPIGMVGYLSMGYIAALDRQWELIQ